MSSRIKRCVAVLAVMVYTAESLSSSSLSSRQSVLSISTSSPSSTTRIRKAVRTPLRECTVLYNSEIDPGFDKNELNDELEDDDDDDNNNDTGEDSPRSLVASPLSQMPAEDDEQAPIYRGPFSRNDQWLEDATEEMLDVNRVPLGSLSEDDVESIVGLMAAWVRRRSVDAALTVEQLLKRVVDDMRAHNPVCVTTKMYTIVSSGDEKGRWSWCQQTVNSWVS